MTHGLTIAAGHSSTWVETLGEHDAIVGGPPREVHIRLAADSRLTHYRLLGPDGAPDVADRLTVEIGAGASYEQRMLAAPTGQFRSEQTIRLNGRGASATLSGACVALPQAQLDFDIKVTHEADDTVSDQRITQLNDRLKGLQDQLQQLQQSTAPATDPARDQLRSQIEQGQIELERARFEAQVELQTLEQELLTDFSRRLGPIIERVADERQLHLVLPIRSGFLWAHPGLDLTDEVMRRFNTGQ